MSALAQPTPQIPKKKRLWLTLILAIGIPVFVVFGAIITIIILLAVTRFNAKNQTLATEAALTQIAPHIVSADYSTSCDGFNCNNPNLKLYMDTDTTDDVTTALSKVIPYLWHHSDKGAIQVVIFVYDGDDTVNSVTGSTDARSVNIQPSLKALGFTEDQDYYSSSIDDNYANFQVKELQQKYGNR